MLICAYAFFQFLGICSAYVLVSGNLSMSVILMHWKGRFLDFSDLRELLLWA
jgi:amino acid permease